MAYAGGLGSQIGWAPEVTYGTASTPTAWLEAKKQSLDLKVEHMMSPALQSGLRVQRADRFVVNKKGVHSSFGQIHAVALRKKPRLHGVFFRPPVDNFPEFTLCGEFVFAIITFRLTSCLNSRVLVYRRRA